MVTDNIYSDLHDCLQPYLKSQDILEIERAYHFAKEAHTGLVRRSGEPYITHPVRVAMILADWRMDRTTILAALLHDVVEDTTITSEKIFSEFGQPVATIGGWCH